MKFASFNRFELELPDDCVSECSHSGNCDDDVTRWANKIERPKNLTAAKLAAELKEYGAWSNKELKDDFSN